MATVSADGYSVNINMDNGEFQKLGEMSTLNDKWIYESPDGGKTIYRRKVGSSHESRELYVQGKSEHYYDYDRNGNTNNPFIPRPISSEIETTWAEMDAMEPLTPTPLGTPKKVWIAEMDTDVTVKVPREALKSLNWKEGDTLQWSTNSDGSLSLRKPYGVV